MYKILNYTFQNLPKEEEEQKHLVGWLKRNNIDFFAPVNENKQSFTNKKVALILENKAKLMGKKKGVIDMLIYLPEILLHIELKRQKPILKSGKRGAAKNKPTKEQLEFLDMVKKYSYCDGYVCYGCDEAIKIIKDRR